MADKKLRTRLASDGYSYPYTSPKLVLDENGNNLENKIQDFDNRIGIQAHYVKSDDSTGLLVVADGTVTDETTQIEESKVTGLAVAGEYVKVINSTGVYKYIDDKSVNVDDLDMSNYQAKEDDTLITDDKTITGAINEIDTEIGTQKTDTEDSTGLYKYVDDNISTIKIELVRDDVGTDGISFD